MGFSVQGSTGGDRYPRGQFQPTHGQNNLILEASAEFSYQEGRKIPVRDSHPHDVLQSYAQSNFCSYPTSLIPPLAMFLLFSIQQRRKTVSKFLPRSVQVSTQHKFILQCVYSASQEMESEPNSSLKLTCAPTNFLFISQGSIKPIKPSWTIPGLVRTDLPM